MKKEEKGGAAKEGAVEELEIEEDELQQQLKRPVCTVGWVARLCRSWLFPGKTTRISYGRNPIGTILLKKKRRKKEKRKKED